MGVERAGVVPMESMIERALEFCAKRTEYDGAEAALAAIRAGDCTACRYFRYGLAKNIGRYLGDADPSVLVVYTFEPEYCVVGGGGAAGELDETLGINMIAVADGDTERLFSIIASLEDALKRTGPRLFCPAGNGCCFALDVKVTDQEEVASKRGYGAPICSIRVMPLKVWERVREQVPDSVSSGVAAMHSDN